MLPDGRVVVVIDGGGSTVIEREENIVGYVMDVATTVTVIAEATVAGAL
jgi:hypothetical protein